MTTTVTMTIDTSAGPTIMTGQRLDEPGHAWTPNDWQDDAPEAGMVRVRWDSDTDPLWEYSATLTDVVPAIGFTTGRINHYLTAHSPDPHSDDIRRPTRCGARAYHPADITADPRLARYAETMDYFPLCKRCDKATR